MAKSDPTLAAMPQAKRSIAADKVAHAIDDLRVLEAALRATTPEMKASRATRMLRSLDSKVRDILKDIMSNTDWT